MAAAVSLDALVRAACGRNDDAAPSASQVLGLAEQALAFSGAPRSPRHRSILASLLAPFRARDDVARAQTRSTPSLHWSPSLEPEAAPDALPSPRAHAAAAEPAASPPRNGAALAGLVSEPRDIVLVWEFGAGTVRALLLEGLAELRSTCAYLFAVMLFETRKRRKSVSETRVGHDADRAHAGTLVMWTDAVARCVTPRGRECPFVSLPRVRGSDVLRFSREAAPAPLCAPPQQQPEAAPAPVPWAGVHSPAIHLFVWNGTAAARDVRLAAFARAQTLDGAFAIPSAVHAAVAWAYESRARPAAGGAAPPPALRPDSLGAVVRALLLAAAQQARPVSLGRKTTVITLVHERFSKIRQHHKSLPHSSSTVHGRTERPHEDSPLVARTAPADEQGRVRRGRLSRSFTAHTLRGPERALLAESPGAKQSLGSSHRQTTSDRGELLVPRALTTPPLGSSSSSSSSSTNDAATATAVVVQEVPTTSAPVSASSKEAEDTGKGPVAGRVCLAARAGPAEGAEPDAEHKKHRSHHRHHGHSRGHRRQASDTPPEGCCSSSSNSGKRLSLNLSAAPAPLLSARARVTSLSLPTSQRGSHAVLPAAGEDDGEGGGEGGGARLYRGVLSEVDDGLFLTGDEGAGDLAALRRCGVTCIVNAADRVCREHFPGEFRYYALDLLDDGAREDLRPLFLEVIDIVEQQRARGGATVLHCQQGISRSATLAIAHAMWRHRLPFRAALERVTARRPVVSPNGGFMGQLLLWEAVLRSVWARAPGPRLLRVAPHAGSHHEVLLVGRDVAVAARASLDPRGCFVLHDPADGAAYTWLGEHSCEAYRQGARKLAGQLQRLLGVASVVHELQGFESRDFWCALGDVPGPIAPVAAFDTDCGKLAPAVFHRFPAWDPVDPRAPRPADEARCQAWASYRPLSSGSVVASGAESSGCPSSPATTATAAAAATAANPGQCESPCPDKPPGVALVWVPEHFVVRTPDGHELRDPAQIRRVVFSAFVSAGGFPASTVCHHITTLDELARLQRDLAGPSAAHSSVSE